MTERNDPAVGHAPPLFAALLVLTAIAGCAAPQLQQRTAESGPARLDSEEAIMTDGYRLPLRRWGDPDTAEAFVLALHGFNDYSNAFADVGAYLAAKGVLTYAFDQRGFGASAQRGRWAGEDPMIADLKAMVRLLRDRHSRIPLFLLGESMGGAVVMSAVAKGTGADGVILIAPAVWSRDTMNPLQRLALQVAAHTLPWLELTGRGLNIRPSDNLDMLRALSADPLVIKGTRVDALWGVTNIMDLGMEASTGFKGPALLLYGENDEIIPKNAFCAMLDQVAEETTGVRIVLYEQGWHMLTRDLQGERVMADIASWIEDANAPMPSGEETHAESRRLEEALHALIALQTGATARTLPQSAATWRVQGEIRPRAKHTPGWQGRAK